MRFYKVDFSPNSSKYSRRYDVSASWEAMCETCGMSSGIPHPPFDLRIKATPLPDVIHEHVNLFVQNHVKEAVQEAELTGIQYLQPQIEVATNKPLDEVWELYKVGDRQSRLYRVSKHEIQTGAPLEGLPLWHLNVTGSAGLHPENNCVLVQECEVCGYTRYSTWDDGLVIDESQWDGSDFFRLKEHPGFIIVTQAVKVLFQKKKITGVRLTNLEQIVDEFAKYRPPRPTK